VLYQEPAGPLLAQWQNFYVIAGSSAGALTGLQFVVMALNSKANKWKWGSQAAPPLF